MYDKDENPEVLSNLVLEYSTVIVEGIIVSFMDPIDDTKSSEIVGDFPSSLVESVVVMMVDITGVNCSVVIGSSVSVDVGSNEMFRDPVTIKVGSIAFDGSIVVCFTADSKPVTDV